MPQKRPLTAGYVFFYLIFWPDTWRILIGVAAAWGLAPRLVSPAMGPLGAAMIYLMLATIGYALSAVPGRWISAGIKRFVLKVKRP
ncbi:MAG: hypothetical protein WAM73_18460 [Desulfobacterales bacterium]